MRPARTTEFRFPGRYYAVVAVALGLVLLATAIWIRASTVQGNKANQATDFSAVPAAVDFAAPPLALRDLAGKEHSLTDYRGRVVLVNLWATWCPPCEAEMPILEAYYLKHSREGFEVVAVEDGDPASQVAAFVADHGITFPVWLDPSYEATDHAFKTADLPSSYIVDREGIVRLMWIGAINPANLEKYVTPLIQE